jgi:hypothetical protein
MKVLFKEFLRWQEIKEISAAKKMNQTGHQWLTSVILAIQEAKIRRIMVQPEANSLQNPTLKKPNTKQGW